MEILSNFCWLTGFITFPKQNILYAFYICQQLIQNIIFILNCLKSISIFVKMRNENNYFRLIYFIGSNTNLSNIMKFFLREIKNDYQISFQFDSHFWVHFICFHCIRNPVYRSRLTNYAVV
jgi:hypothetical protein